MSSKSQYLGKDISVPNALNIVIALSSTSFLCFLLWQASHTNHLYIQLICFILFGFIGNTVFGLLHDTVHSNFNTNRKVNYIFGNLFSAFFPTGYSFQRSCHLGHHRNNRTDYEMFEAFHEKDNKLAKTVMLYFILTGVYWIFPPIGAFLLLLSPKLLLGTPFSGNNYEFGRMGGTGMLKNLRKANKKEVLKMRLEVLFTLCFQVSLFYFLDLSFLGWLICYIGFAVQWSGLQYADHAYSARDIRNGAWNLKVSKLTQYLYLNYHHHLAHHQHPHVPWIHLHKFVDFEAQRPSYWSIYLKMWKGLVKVDYQPVEPIDKKFETLIESDLFNS